MAAVLVATMVGVVPVPVGQADLRQGPDAAGVTLITGDRVVVTGRGFRVLPGPGRRVGFTHQVQDGHLYVIPSDARPLVAANTLDRRLFDVTQLLAWRYGDAAPARSRPAPPSSGWTAAARTPSTGVPGRSAPPRRGSRA
ncbi:hypothetical protein ACIBIZ_16325 [Nonomuraea spiralis]|uniref:hypothetical protein n=1 Tax=Nonomuraea spiralis TaxID=46182 RepID=UPI00379C500A